MGGENFMKWLRVTAFALVLLGGINWLFIGLMDIDLFGAMLGGGDSAASRVLFTLFGLGALTLLLTIYKAAFRDGKNN